MHEWCLKNVECYINLNNVNLHAPIDHIEAPYESIFIYYYYYLFYYSCLNFSPFAPFPACPLLPWSIPTPLSMSTGHSYVFID